ncbi:MAG: response regulator [Myxococcota bacterium]
MIQIPKILVVDDAAVVREMLSAVLNPHCDEILTAADIETATICVREHSDITLILCDVVLPDGNGLELLESLSGRDSRPDVILMTGRPNHDDARRADELGAIGYLPKPIGFRAVAQVLQRTEGRRNAPPRFRGTPVGRAYLLGPLDVLEPASERDPRRVWDVRDMSVSGAFLETKGPIEPGTLLDLCLDFGPNQAHVRALTVRVQEPGWGRPAGVGIEFQEMDARSRGFVESHLAEIDGEFH